MPPRDNPLLQRIQQDPGICNGKPRIQGTRLSVELLLSLLSQGATAAELLEDYPALELADLHAAMAYAHARIPQTCPPAPLPER